MIDNKYYTWLDILNHLELAVKNEILPKGTGVEAYWDGVKIYKPKKVKAEQIVNALEEVFKARFELNEAGMCIVLEGHSLETPNSLPIFIEELSDDFKPFPFKPTFKRPPIIVNSKSVKSENRKASTINFLAFFSFKGGVGRTLSAMGLSRALSQKGEKVLLVDADLEAPGITWMLGDGERTFSLTDFLALLHGSEKDENVIAIAKEYLKITHPALPNVHIMPAFRYKEQMQWLDIKPEHITSYSESPFRLTTAITDLAESLSCKHIIIDLRAGFSELSSNWLLDPIIKKVFVTTLASQSLSGTNLVLETYGSILNENGINEIDLPFLIFSQVQDQIKNTVTKNWENIDFNSNEEIKDEQLQLQKELKQTLVKYFIKNKDTENDDFYSGAELIVDELSSSSLFLKDYDSLRSLPQNLKVLIDRISQSKIDSEILKGISNWLSVEDTASPINEADIKGIRKKLSETASNIIFAEKQVDDKLLVTTSISNLINDYRNEVPISVIIGPKGAGKTFLFRQLIQSKNWARFSEKGGIKSEHSIPLFPVILPKNIKDINSFIANNQEAMDLVKGSGSNILSEHIIPTIESDLRRNLTQTEWRNKWLDYLAWSIGFEVGKLGANVELIKFLQSSNKKIIGVIDGLEELFDGFHKSEAEQSALAALIQDLPNWLESIPGRPLGIIIFIRQDIINYVIKQNFGQFIDRYKEYQLKWNSEEVLRLVYWIIQTYQIPGFDFQTPAEDMKEEDLIVKLYSLWGKRMAKDRSKEAYSHKWILGQLTNLKGEIQSRDVVRFLQSSAQNSFEESNDTFKDRVLLPNAIRRSVQFVGTEKIDEVRQENKALEPVFKKLSEYVSTIKFPCKKEDLAMLDQIEIKLLEDSGILVLYRGDYYMSELYRRGFGFEYSRKGKPKFIF